MKYVSNTWSETTKAKFKPSANAARTILFALMQISVPSRASFIRRLNRVRNQALNCPNLAAPVVLPVLTEKSTGLNPECDLSTSEKCVAQLAAALDKINNGMRDPEEATGLLHAAAKRIPLGWLGISPLAAARIPAAQIYTAVMNYRMGKPEPLIPWDGQFFTTDEKGIQHRVPPIYINGNLYSTVIATYPECDKIDYDEIWDEQAAAMTREIDAHDYRRRALRRARRAASPFKQ